MPAHGKGLAAVKHPGPVHSLINLCGEFLDFLVGKILTRRENAAQKNRGVDGGEFALLPAVAGFHVDEMKEEPVLVVQIAGDKAQRLANALENLRGFPVSTLMADAEAG